MGGGVLAVRRTLSLSGSFLPVEISVHTPNNV